LALIMSAYRVNSNLPIIKDQGVTDAISRELYYFAGWCAVAAVAFVVYTVNRVDLANLILGRWSADRIPLATTLLNAIDFGKSNSAQQLRPPQTKPDETGLLLLMAVFVVFVIVLLAGPNLIAEWLPLAFSISLILGGWLPIFTYLSAIGRRLQAPLIFAAL